LYDDNPDSADEAGEIASHQEGDERLQVSLDSLKQKILGRPLHTNTTEESSPHQWHSKMMSISHCPPDLKRELQCAICHDCLFQPVSLPCGHSFCQECWQWWFSQCSAASNCPTCRQAVERGDVGFGINTALRACVQALLGSEWAERVQAKRKAEAGENGGAHDKGFAVLCDAQDCPWKQIIDGNYRVRRSSVTDSLDQRMQLMLALASPIHVSPGTSNKRLHLSICLLHMEEDEAADGSVPWIVDSTTDDEHLICTEERFHCSFIEVTALLSSSDEEGTTAAIPVARHSVENDGTCQFDVNLNSLPTSKGRTLRFRHEETGALLEVQLGEEATGLGQEYDERLDVGRRNRSNVLPSRYIKDSDHDSEEEDQDEYENDGFIVMDGEEEEDGDDTCYICHERGELVICDGGDDHPAGCGKSFHIACINRETVPPGDWICQDCANGIGLDDVGVEGHEFVALDDGDEPASTTANGRLQKRKKRMDDDDDSEEFGASSSDAESGGAGESMDSDEEVVPSKKKMKRPRVFESDDDED
jgi:hypothetical protein